MPSQTSAAIVAGVDGSEQSLVAVEFAADEAERRGMPLRLVHGFLWPAFAPIAASPDPGTTATAITAAEQMLDGIAADVRQRHPGLAITTAVSVGSAASVLVAESEHAGLVVVGDRGRGGFLSLLAGSVATQLAAHARSPVIIVRPGVDPSALGAATHPVVVGVDGTERSEAAIEFAFEEAASRGVSLTAVHVWCEPPRSGADQFKPAAFDFDEAHKDADRALAESLAGFGEKYPEVTVFRSLICSLNPQEVLLEASEEAGLVVVGSRGRGGFTGLLLGSVGQALVHHANCPVAVVRDTATDAAGRS